MGHGRRDPLMIHCQTPYEQFLCDDNAKVYGEDDRSGTLREIDCPDCIEAIWDILEEAMV